MSEEITYKKKVVRITSGTHPAEYAGTRLVDLLDWQACYAELLVKIHPFGLACGGCGGTEAIGHGKTKTGFPRHKCRSCGVVYTALSGTPFSGTRMGAKELILFMRLWHTSAPCFEIGAEVGLSAGAIRQLQKNLTLHKKYNKAGAE